MLDWRAVSLALAAVLLTAASEPPNPNFWAQQPSPAERQAARKAAGVEPGAAGRAVVVCKAKADGRLDDCHAKLESPGGSGLAKALLSLAPLYRVNMAFPQAPKAGDEVPILDASYRIDTAADWVRKPTFRDLMTVWPTEAYARGKGGKATISCLVSLQGALFDCVAITESPPGESFGVAAVALAPQFLMKPAMLNGQPVVSTVSVPIKFYMPPGPLPQMGGKSKGLVAAAMAWPEAPDYAAVAAAYPAKAKAAKLGGRATLNCEFNREGRLRNCEVITEEPKHEGFGEAAELLAKAFRAPSKMSDGSSIAGASVQLPVVFDPAMLTDRPPVIGKPVWAGLPSAEETSAAFGGLEATGAAHVRLECVVLAGGGVSNCKVESEEPAGKGVGQAALSLAPYFRLSTWTAEGLPTVGGAVSIPLRYEVKAAEPSTAPKD